MITHPCFQIDCKPIRNINFLILFGEFGVKVDTSQIFDFHNFEHIVNGDIVVGVSGQNMTLIVENSVFLYRCAAFYARQFCFFDTIRGGAIVVVDVANVVIRGRHIGHVVEISSIVSWQFPAFYIRIPCGGLLSNERKKPIMETCND